MRFAVWLLDRLRFKRLAVNPQMKYLAVGALYSGNYSNFKHDPKPLLFVMWCDEKIVHAFNCNYFSKIQKKWMGQTIYLIKKANQNIDPRTLYRFIKQRRPDLLNYYRQYHTELLNMKLVSAGITNLDSLLYTVSSDPWIAALNELIKPSEMIKPPSKISFSPTELQERVNLALSSTDLRKGTVGGQPPAPYTNKPPYMR
jgi:L-rhamnose mutarotase